MVTRLSLAVHNALITESINELFEDASGISDCDCCQYFDMDLERFGGMEYPIYYPLNKGETNELKFINPKQYIYAIARGFGNLSYDDATSHVNWDNVKKYAQDMKNGDKFPIGYYTEGNSNQEGRHRALALMELGCEKMPVIVVRKLSDDERDRFAMRFKDMSPEDLNSTFQHLGYDGVKSLDISELRNYVKYRLGR